MNSFFSNSLNGKWRDRNMSKDRTLKCVTNYLMLKETDFFLIWDWEPDSKFY